MVIPSRWFAGGRGLDDFRDTMLNDKSIREIHDFIDASECFPGVEIKGGVCYFLWDRDKKGTCRFVAHEKEEIISVLDRDFAKEENKIIVRYNNAMPILDKIRNFKEKTIDAQVSSQRPFGFRTFFKGNKSKFANCVKIYANQETGYVLRDEVLVNEKWLDLPKVIVPRAIGTGDSKSDRIKPIYCEPGACCTETYVVFGPYSTDVEAKNLISFINTKFFHFLVTLQKNTMMAPKSVYSFVPIQDLTQSWTDEELYAKYNLNKEEIDFIESMIRPMVSSIKEKIYGGDENE